MLGLTLCVLPMYLQAATGQDLKPSINPPRAEHTIRRTDSGGHHSSCQIEHCLRSDKIGSGTTIIATVMQDRGAGQGETLRKGSKITGHVVEAITPGKGSDESKISFQFDQLQLRSQTIPLSTTCAQ